MILISDEKLIESLDTLVYNFFSEECCSEHSLYMIRIMLMLYELDSTNSESTLAEKEAIFKQKIEEILKEYQCYDKSNNPVDGIDLSSYDYILNFFCSKYNAILKYRKNVCFCDVIKVIISSVMLNHDIKTTQTYGLLLDSINEDTLSLIQKFIEDENI